MSRYINTDDLIPDCCVDEYGDFNAFSADQIDSMKNVEIIRCKQCKHYWKENCLCTHENTTDGNVCCLQCSDDFFCAYGEKRRNKK